MNMTSAKPSNRVFRKAGVVLTLVAFLFNSVLPAYAQSVLSLPQPGAMVKLSAGFDPTLLKAVKVHTDNPFKFDFIVDTGDTGLTGDELKKESTRLIKYFLAALTTPENDFWVNLSPYEKDKIIPETFGKTEMGRDLLAQDYLLKQITASLVYPEDELGQKFWSKIYAEAQAKFGTTDIPVDTFNKVWVVPEKAVVYENGVTAYVGETKLKVMLEQDYLALAKGAPESQSPGPQNSGTLATGALGNPSDVNSLGSQIVREIILPELTREVNEGKNFATLRQVYHSLILANWYKKRLKDSILAKVYMDKGKIKGVEYDSSVIATSPEGARKQSQSLTDEIARKDDVEKIYQQYFEAFKKGVYNYIREDINPATKEMIPRKYFSGGFRLSAENTVLVPLEHMPVAAGISSGSFQNVKVDTTPPEIANGLGVSAIGTSPVVLPEAKALGIADQVRRNSSLFDLNVLGSTREELEGLVRTINRDITFYLQRHKDSNGYVSSRRERLKKIEFAITNLGVLEGLHAIAAVLLGLEKDENGEYKFVEYVSQNGGADKAVKFTLNGIDGVIRLEKDAEGNDVLVIVHAIFKGINHAGRDRNAVYAASEAKARHEFAELAKIKEFARENGIDIREGLGKGIFKWANDPNEDRLVRQNLLRQLDYDAHQLGLKAEADFEGRSHKIDEMKIQPATKVVDDFDWTIAGDGGSQGKGPIYLLPTRWNGNSGWMTPGAIKTLWDARSDREWVAISESEDYLRDRRGKIMFQLDGRKYTLSSFLNALNLGSDFQQSRIRDGGGSIIIQNAPERTIAQVQNALYAFAQALRDDRYFHGTYIVEVAEPEKEQSIFGAIMTQRITFTPRGREPVFDPRIPVAKSPLNLTDSELKELRPDIQGGKSAFGDIYLYPKEFHAEGYIYKVLQEEMPQQAIIIEANFIYELNLGKVPGVLQIVGRGMTSDGRIYIKLKGPPNSVSLQGFKGIQEWSLLKKIVFLRKLADIYKAIQASGIAHFDIKIANVIVDPQTEEPVVIDFSVSKQASLRNFNQDIRGFERVVQFVLGEEHLSKIKDIVKNLYLPWFGTRHFMHDVAEDLQEVEFELPSQDESVNDESTPAIGAGETGLKVAPEVRTDIAYPDSSVNPNASDDDQRASTVFMDLHNSRFSFAKWNQRTAEPFTEEEKKVFEDPSKIESLKLSPDQIKNFRHTYYDRSSGDIEILAVAEDTSGQKHFYRFKGSDTTSMRALKEIMPTLDQLKDPLAAFQVSLGNQGDLIGNFTVTSKNNQWEFFGGVNEPWQQKTYRSLVQLTNGEIKLGFIRMAGDVNNVSKVFFRPGVDHALTNEVELSPQDTDFILVAYTLGWGSSDVAELLRENYDATSDLRHIFRFPFMNGSVFHGQLAASGQKLSDAFDNKPVDFEMTHQSQVLIREDLEKLLTQNGYIARKSSAEIASAGDYYINGNSIRIQLLPARYPVNALVVGEDGKRMAFVSVQGKSGQKGADYWSFSSWAKSQVKDQFGWEPQAVFALDNGMDPYVRQFNADGTTQVLVQGGRENFNAALSVVTSPVEESGVLAIERPAPKFEKDKEWQDLHRVLTDALADPVINANPAFVEALQAAQRAFDFGVFVTSQKGAYGLSRRVEIEPGLWDNFIGFNHELMMALHEKAKTDNRYKALVYGLFIKEGAAILDFETNPAYHEEIVRLEKEKSLSDGDFKKLMAMKTEAEAKAYRVFMDYLIAQSGDVNQAVANLNDLAREDKDLSTMATGFRILLQAMSLKDDINPEFPFKVVTFAFTLSPFLRADIRGRLDRILEQDGHPKAVENMPWMFILKNRQAWQPFLFLVDPQYVGRKVAETSDGPAIPIAVGDVPDLASQKAEYDDDNGNNGTLKVGGKTLSIIGHEGLFTDVFSYDSYAIRVSINESSERESGALEKAWKAHNFYYENGIAPKPYRYGVIKNKFGRNHDFIMSDRIQGVSLDKTLEELEEEMDIPTTEEIRRAAFVKILEKLLLLKVDLFEPDLNAGQFMFGYSMNDPQRKFRAWFVDPDFLVQNTAKEESELSLTYAKHIIDTPSYWEFMDGEKVLDFLYRKMSEVHQREFLEYLTRGQYYDLANWLGNNSAQDDQAEAQADKPAAAGESASLDRTSYIRTSSLPREDELTNWYMESMAALRGDSTALKVISNRLLIALKSGEISPEVFDRYFSINQSFNIVIPNFPNDISDKRFEKIVDGNIDESYQIAIDSIKEKKKNKRLLIVGIAGEAAAGKSHFAERLQDMLFNNNLRVAVLQVDGYLRSRQERRAKSLYGINAIEFSVMKEDIRALRSGSPIMSRKYVPLTGEIIQDGMIDPNEFDVILLEGDMSFVQQPIRDDMDLKIFLDEPFDVRFDQRVKRDSTERGYTTELAVWNTLEKEFQESPIISSQKEIADIVISPLQGNLWRKKNDDGQNIKSDLENNSKRLLATGATLSADLKPGEAPGGIDLNADKLNVDIRGNGQPISFDLDPAEIENLEFDGLTPTIITITPVTNLPLFLSGVSEEPSSATQLSMVR